MTQQNSTQKKLLGDFTCGSIPKKLILFALPVLGANLLQQLYNTVDVLIAANFSNDHHAMSAVGASSYIVYLIVGFFTGFSVGAGVVISQHLGAKRYESLSKAVHTAIALSIIGGIVLMITGIGSAYGLLVLLHTPAELISSAAIYLIIYFCGLPALFLYNMGTGIFRAMGDSRRPLLFLAIGGILNVLLDLVFVAWFQWGVIGVALATLITEILPAALVITFLIRSNSHCKIIIKKIRIHKDVLKQIIHIGLPAGIQSMVITISNMVTQTFINGYGAEAVAAMTAYGKIENALWLPLFALGQTATTFVSQNYGAGQLRRANRGLLLCLAIGFGLTICTSTFLLVFAKQVFGIFLHTQAEIDCGLKLIPFTFTLYFLYCFLEILPGAIRGLGQSTAPMIILMVNRCVLLLGLLFLFTSIWDSLLAVTAGYPITWIITLTCLVICYVVCYRKRKKELEASKTIH